VDNSWASVIVAMSSQPPTLDRAGSVNSASPRKGMPPKGGSFANSLMTWYMARNTGIWAIIGRQAA
jgi:hypothetical protein